MSEENTDRTNGKEEELHKMDDEKERDERLSVDNGDTAGEPAEESGDQVGQIESDFEKLQKQLEESDRLTNSYKDQLYRLAAEFENFRKRNETDKAEFIKYSNEKMIRDLIPILDDFERALSTGKKSSDFDSFYKGVEMIYQKLRKVFEEKGVEPIESVGKEFDVAYHDVLMQIPKPGVSPHTIVEEVERGYTMHGKVIKHAKVIVAADNSEESPANGETGSEESK